MLIGKLCLLRSGTGELSWLCVHKSGVVGTENKVLAQQQTHQPDGGAGMRLDRGQGRTIFSEQLVIAHKLQAVLSLTLKVG